MIAIQWYRISISRGLSFKFIGLVTILLGEIFKNNGSVIKGFNMNISYKCHKPFAS